MKNLLTKTLFISLLLSAVMPSGVQAGFFTTNGKQFAKVALGTGAGLLVGTAAGVKMVVTIVEKVGIIVELFGIPVMTAVGAGPDPVNIIALEVIKGEIAVLLSPVAAGLGAAGAGIGAAAVELTLGSGGAVATGAGVGATITATIAGLATVEKSRGIAVMVAVVGTGAVVGAGIGAAMVRKIIAKYFSRRTAADEIIRRTS